MRRVMQSICAAACLAAATCTTAMAQATNPATAAVPATQPAATQPATTTFSGGPTTAPAKVTMNFKDAPLDTVLDFMSKTIGFEIMKDGPIDARVNIFSKQPVSPEEAVTLLNASLKANGFTVVREGRLLHVVSRDKAKKGNVPVHFGSDPKEIAETDEIITQVVPIQNVSALKLRDDLKVFMPDADVAANDGSNSLIITDASSSIRRIVQIVAKLDEHEAETSEMRIVQLRHANAAATAKLLDTFFKAPAAGPQQPQNGMSPQQMQQMQQAGGGGHGSERHGVHVTTASDDRTNTLLVMASGATLKAIDKILEQLDADNPNPVPASTMRTYTLKFASAEETAKLINTVFKSSSDNSSLPYYIIRSFGGGDDQKKDVKINAAADERTNSIIVTGSVEGMKSVEDLIQLLDANPLAAADLKVFHLKHAEAFTVSKLIEDMFKPKDDSGMPFRLLYIYSDNAAPQQGKKIKVNVTADDRTNSLIVTAPTDLMKIIGNVVQELDADPTTEDTLFIYHLRNGQAQNLEYVLNVLFGNITESGQNGQQNGQGPNGNQQNGNNNNRFNNNNNGGGGGDFNNSNNSNSNTSASRRQARQQNRPGGRGASPAIAKAINELTGRVLVVAEPDTNALLVTTATKYEKQVRLIIDDLDRPVPQVLIKVLVAEVTHDNAADFGLDFSILNQRPSGRGQTGISNFGNAGLTPGVLVSVVEKNLTATLHALAEQNKLDVLSRPYILASDNQLANIFIGSNVPFVTNSTLSDNGQLFNTVQYRDIGLNLNVTPHINPDGVVILDVNPEIQQLTGQSITITNNSSNPVIAKRSAESRIGVMDGQTIVIGGLMEDRKTSKIDKIPLLGDIPLLGQLFRRTQVTTTKTELLIFLTPHVAQKPESLGAMSEDESKGMKLTPNAVQPGTFQEQIKGMRRGELPQTQPIKPLSPVNSIDLSEGANKRAADLREGQAETPITQPAGK